MGDGEEWRAVKDFEGLYEISDMGRIRRLVFRNGTTQRRYKQPHILSPAKLRGYPRIVLHKLERKRQTHIHLLVLETFVGPRPPGLYAAHLNGAPDDCRLSNLAWVTCKENHSHKLAHGTAQTGERNGATPLTEDDVSSILIDSRASRALAKVYGVHPTTIQNIRAGKTWRFHPARAALNETETKDG